MSSEFEQVLTREIPGREEFLGELRKLYPPEDVHGLDHALRVEQKAFEVLEIACQEAGEKIAINPLVLSFAALGHDVGYTALDRMSADKFEHTIEGAKTIEQIVEKYPFLSSREKEGISRLIKGHDDMTYSYPLKTREGKPCLSPKEIAQRERAVANLGFLLELKILREADSSFVTGEEGLKRTIEFSSRKELDFFADKDNPLRADMWEVSIAGNLRLCSRRAFADAFTRKGKMLALVGWAVQELEIFRRCQKKGIEFFLDPCLVESSRNWK